VVPKQVTLVTYGLCTYSPKTLESIIIYISLCLSHDLVVLIVLLSTKVVRSIIWRQSTLKHHANPDSVVIDIASLKDARGFSLC
jgi:hypothetical protein